MKLLFTILAFSVFMFSSNAQLTKGNWLTGGTGKLYTYNRDYSTSTFSVQYKYTDIDVSASVGYFVADMLAFGLRPNFSWLKGEGVSGTGASGLRTNTKRYGIGPFVRYYFLNKDKPFNILSDISYQFGVINPEGESGKANTFSFLTGPVIYFNSSVGLEFLLGYSSKTEELKDNYKDVRKGFQIGIGFQIHLIK
ncbi:MAG: hypothetical protein ABIP79_11800 [Chitinophagaceae bacterium]